MQPNKLVTSPLGRALHRICPPRVFWPLRDAAIAYRDSRKLWRLPEWPENVKRLQQWKNCYQGKRCFIIGNGPSLRETDLSLLRGEYTFGLNRIYLKFEEMGFPTSFLVCINKLVIEQCADELTALPIPQFISLAGRHYVHPSPHTMFVARGKEPVRFSRDITQFVTEGSTVTYTAMQIAYYMGFNEVVLIGVDHNFTTQGQPHQEVTSTGDDPNHFDPNYFGRGFRWQLPDLEGSELAYHVAKVYYERDNRRILDATIGGKLTVFEKVDYNALFRESNAEC